MDIAPSPPPASSGWDLLYGIVLLGFGVFYFLGVYRLGTREWIPFRWNRIVDRQRVFQSKALALAGVLWTGCGLAFLVSVPATMVGLSSASFLLAGPILVAGGLAGWSFELLNRPATLAVLVTGVGAFLTAFLVG